MAVFAERAHTKLNCIATALGLEFWDFTFNIGTYPATLARLTSALSEIMDCRQGTVIVGCNKR